MHVVTSLCVLFLFAYTEGRNYKQVLEVSIRTAQTTNKKKNIFFIKKENLKRKICNYMVNISRFCVNHPCPSWKKIFIITYIWNCIFHRYLTAASGVSGPKRNFVQNMRLLSAIKWGYFNLVLLHLIPFAVLKVPLVIEFFNILVVEMLQNFETYMNLKEVCGYAFFERK